MSDKKHIDRIFQEKLKDFEATPNPKVWQNIQGQLNHQKPKATPLWLRYIGVAALLVILLTVGGLLLTDNNSTTKTVDTEQPQNNEKAIPNSGKDAVTNIPLNETNSDINTEKAPSDFEDNNKLTETSSNSKEATIYSNPDNQETKTPQLTEQDRVVQKSLNTRNGTSDKQKGSTLVSDTENKKLPTDENNNHITKTTSNTVQQKLNTKTNESPSLNTSQNRVKNAVADTQKSIKNTENRTSSVRATDKVLNTSDSQNTVQTVTSNDINRLKNTSLVETLNKTNTAVADSLFSKPLKINDTLTIEAAIAIAKSKNINEEEKLENRWQVYTNIAPVYYNSLGKGSHLDDQFVSNKKNGETNTSYGVSVSYAVSKKFAIRSGVNKLNLSYDTDGVILYETPNSNSPTPSPLRNVTLSSGNESLTALSADNLGVQSVDGLFNYNAAISQRMSYYEVPIEAQYKLVNNRRFGIDIIGGVSSFFLDDNQVYSEFDGYKTYIGEANNINNMSFSGNLGFGIIYKFSEKFKFNLEPTFKYQFNAFENTSGNFKPYIIGAYTGFNYRF